MTIKDLQDLQQSLQDRSLPLQVLLEHEGKTKSLLHWKEEVWALEADRKNKSKYGR